MLNLKSIKSLFSDTIYKSGLQYFQQNRVSKLTYNPEENYWYAKVTGNNIYEVEVEILEDKTLYYCDCSTYINYSHCKHCAAVLIGISEKTNNKSVMSQQDDVKDSVQVTEHEDAYEIAIDMIDVFAEVADLPAKSDGIGQPIKIEYVLKVESRQWEPNLLSVEMKIGVDRLYVVKNVREFLMKVEQYEEIYFTDKFTFEPGYHYFQDRDKEIINILKEISNSESFYVEQNRWFASTTKQKGINIPPLFSERLLTKLEGQKCKLDTGHEIYQDFRLMDEQLPFQFNLSESEGKGYELNMNLVNSSYFLQEYNIAILNNVIYKVTKDQLSVLNKMDKSIKMVSNGSLPIEEEQIEAFLSHVIPGLKQIGQVKLSEEILEKVHEPAFQAKMYLNQEADKLFARLEYHYDDIIIFPFSHEPPKKKEEKLLIRNTQKEREVMRLIEYASFKYNGTDLYIENVDAIFSFMYDLLPKLHEKMDVYMTDQVKQLIHEDQYQPTVQLDLKPNQNFFEVNFDFNDVDQNEMNQLFKSIVEKKRYYRLDDGSFVPLEDDAYASISDLFDELKIKPHAIDDGSITLPIYRSLQVEELISKNKGVKYNETFRQLIDDIKHPSKSEYELPNTLKADLREYQQVGFQWLKVLSHYRFGGILADDMGLGKTLQSIAFLLSEREEIGDTHQPALIISPASLVFNWKNEFEKFAPTLKVQVLSGNKLDREKMLQDISKYDVVITSYPLVRQDIAHYYGYQFSTLILDEAQAIKNHMTKTAKAIKAITADRSFALSGTPIENSLEELWSIFDAILPGYFPNKREFSGLSQERVSRMSRPFILRRLKKDVLKELPDKIETVHTSDLTVEQKQLYLGYLEKIQSEASTALATDGFQKNRMKILAGLTRLRQLCCHPSLFIENYEGESGKMNQLLEMVDNALQNKQRLLIFSQFSSMLQIIKKRLEDENKNVFYLDGQTPSSERVEMAERFNNGEKDIFLISLKAGGTGLNLTGADTVILYDLWWNPAVEEQAAGRAHRMGQKKVVQVYRLITNGTIEEKIFALQQKKKELIENIIHPGETMFSSLSEDEIRELLSV